MLGIWRITIRIRASC